MISTFRRYMKETKAGIALSFCLNLLLYFPIMLITFDLMFIIAQWADVQRANAMMAESIKNRISPIVAPGYDGTLTQSSTYVKVYCNFLVFSQLCTNITMYVIITKNTDNPRYIPDNTDLVFCYSNNMICGQSNNTYPLKNNINVVYISTIARPYQLSFNKYKIKIALNENIIATNIATLID